jgi:hypothetical protein
LSNIFIRRLFLDTIINLKGFIKAEFGMEEEVGPGEKCVDVLLLK